MAAGSAGERLATTETLCPLSSGEVDERVGESLDVAGSSGESELQYLDTGTGAAASAGTGKMTGKQYKNKIFQTR